MNTIETIQSKIYEIRGQRVMLDFDLASMYGVKTGRLNEQVKRNIERFPEDFMFQLTKGELEILKSQIATSNISDNQEDVILKSQIVTSSWGGTRKLPYAFTEQGVAMLSSVLRSPLAIQVNIGIIRAFVEFRRMASTLALPNTAADVAQLRKDFEELKLDIEDILHDQNDINESTREQLDAISTALAELQSKEPRQKPRRPIGFVTPSEEQVTAADEASKLTPPSSVNHILSILCASHHMTVRKSHSVGKMLRALCILPILLLVCLVSSCSNDDEEQPKDYMTQLYEESQTLQYQTADSIICFSSKFYDYLELNPDACNHPYYTAIEEKIYEWSPKCITGETDWDGEMHMEY